MLLTALALGTAAQAAPLNCMVAASNLRAGQEVWAQDIVLGRCDDEQTHTLAYDRTREAMIALVDVPAGSPVGEVPLSQRPAIVEGQPLRLVARVGPVLIERPVVALTRSRQGAPVLVRTEDGQVLSVSFEALQREGQPQ
jgi:flagella basal body P-ring formation protein FlgA